MKYITWTLYLIFIVSSVLGIVLDIKELLILGIILGLYLIYKTIHERKGITSKKKKV